MLKSTRGVGEWRVVVERVDRYGRANVGRVKMVICLKLKKNSVANLAADPAIFVQFNKQLLIFYLKINVQE
jgi:hypothetical protein